MQYATLVTFSSLLHNDVGAALDAHFREKGWKLLQIEGEYQVYFGKGVQVDNSYEYGFSHLLPLDALLAFANQFYNTKLLHSK